EGRQRSGRTEDDACVRVARRLVEPRSFDERSERASPVRIRTVERHEVGALVDPGDAAPAAVDGSEADLIVGGPCDVLRRRCDAEEARILIENEAAAAVLV